MSKPKIAIAALAAAFVVYIVWTWDFTPPAIDWKDTPQIVGKTGKLTIHASDEGKGLRTMELAVLQSGQRQVLLSETYAGSGWPWQDKTPRRSVALTLEAAEMPMIVEGPFELEVTATDQPNIWLFSRTATDRRAIQLDTTPPSIQLLTANHFIRQGGSETLIYRLGEKPKTSGVQVGNDVFRGYPLPERGEGAYICLFGLRYDRPADVSMFVFAEDEAGNRSQAGFRKEVVPVRFRKRSIQISDSFIQKVSGEILSQSDEASEKGTPLDTFLEINGPLREINHKRIAELARQSADQLLWAEPFLQLSNSQVEAAFADQRTYYYKGRLVDEQTHLGFDLASTAASPVECANDGVVVWADYLGIYGNCILVDHGLGLLSLYGHLSSIEVEIGQSVKRGQELGRTGQSGLAGGDHLHFSMILQGIQVNPLEWWDAKWLQRHVFSRFGERRQEDG